MVRLTSIIDWIGHFMTVNAVWFPWIIHVGGRLSRNESTTNTITGLNPLWQGDIPSSLFIDYAAATGAEVAFQVALFVVLLMQTAIAYMRRFADARWAVVAAASAAVGALALAVSWHLYAAAAWPCRDTWANNAATTCTAHVGLGTVLILAGPVLSLIAAGLRDRDLYDRELPAQPWLP